jgi:hypothetical protein
MKGAADPGENDPVSELVIVDTFTKLIFGQEEDYSRREQLIIEAFRAVDNHVALDSHRDMGEYLRALGVREMIQLVSRVRERIAGGVYVVAPEARPTALNHRST